MEKKSIKTPRGTFYYTQTFNSEAEATAAGFGFYFTHYTDEDERIGICIRPLEKLHCYEFALIIYK